MRCHSILTQVGFAPPGTRAGTDRFSSWISMTRHVRCVQAKVHAAQLTVSHKSPGLEAQATWHLLCAGLFIGERCSSSIRDRHTAAVRDKSRDRSQTHLPPIFLVPGHVYCSLLVVFLPSFAIHATHVDVDQTVVTKCGDCTTVGQFLFASHVPLDA